MKNLAFIPAKSFSNRIPRKNFLDINGKTLVDYTIDLATNCKNISEIYLSTDKNYLPQKTIHNLKVHIRSKEQSNPELTVLELINLWLVENKILFDNLILLQPTHPFRTHLEVDKVISKFNKERSSYDSLVTYTSQKIRHIASSSDEINVKRHLVKSERFINGQVYIFKNINNRISYGDKTLLYKTTPSVFDVNVDEPHELELAKILAKEFKKYI